MSKSYGLPGLRIGWLAARDRGLLLLCERYKHFLSICNSAPSEVLAEIALAAREPILARNRGIVRQNLALLGDFFGAVRGARGHARLAGSECPMSDRRQDL